MLGICLTCGHPDHIEQHHVAGHVNYPSLTVPVCTPCHTVLTAWQRAHGVNLDRQHTPHETDRLRALIVGTLDVLRLLRQHHPSEPGPELLLLGGRAFSRLLDLLAPADRPGRWLPDPSQPPREEPPTWWVEEAELDLLVLVATLAADFLDAVGGLPEVPTEALRHVAVNPAGFDAGWRDQLAVEDPSARQLLLDLAGYLQRTHRVVRWLLTVDPQQLPSPELLAEATLWFDTGCRLLDEVVQLTGFSAARP